MTLKQALIFIFTLVVSVPALAKPPAEDPIVFFDGYKQGWRVDSSFVTYNSEGDVVFVGYKNNEPKYIYNVDKKRFEKSYQESEVLKMRPYYYGINQKTDAGLMFLEINENLFSHHIEYDISASIYTGRESPEAWIIILRGHLKNSHHWTSYIGYIDRLYTDGLMNYKFNTYLDYNYELRISQLGDLYIFSAENAILYKIPKNMQRKIIARDNFLYAPLTYLNNILLNSPWCSAIYNTEQIYLFPPYQNNCLKFALKKLSKGDYDYNLSNIPSCSVIQIKEKVSLFSAHEYNCLNFSLKKLSRGDYDKHIDSSSKETIPVNNPLR